MRVGDINHLNLRNPSPVQAPVGLSGRFVVITCKNQAIRMLDIHGELLTAVGNQLMDTGLRQLRKLLQIGGVGDVLESPGDPPTIVLTIGPEQLSFGVQHFRQFVVSEGCFHRSDWLSTFHSSKG